MKLPLLFYGLLFCVAISKAQNTAIPDPNFEQALIDLGYDVAPIDGFVPTAQIDFISVLNIQNRNIEDLTGIEDFASLSILECGNNEITSLNLSNNTILTQLNCEINDLNLLSVKNGNNSNFITFKALSNPNLTCIEVDDAAYSTTNWSEGIDLQMSFSEDCGYFTYVPDDNFEQALIDLGYDSGPLDDYVPTANINTVTTLIVQSENIADLTGIEDFTALTLLNCSNNQLTNIDVSQNTSLTTLSIHTNQLTNLDITNNTSLFLLAVYSNQLTTLDVTNNATLNILECNSNMINNLDVSQNIALTQLRCQNNQLTSIDVSSNVNLTQLYVATNQLTNLDVSNNTALATLFTHENQLTSLDVSLNSALNNFTAYGNELTSLNVKNGNNVNFTQFFAQNNPNLFCIEVDDATYSTTNWTNIDAQTSFSEDCHYGETYVPDDNFEQALIDLGYDSGTLDDYVPTANIETVNSLDVSNENIADLTGIEDFTALETLYCQSNQLTSIDVSQNINLEALGCYNNQLSSLDISQNINLTGLGCSGNQLNSINLSNNFALQLLYVNENQLSSLDVSQNTNLVALVCNTNQLSSLDVSQNINLEALDCHNNQLSSLDVSQNTNLVALVCNTNQLTSLDVSQNINLETLLSNNNQLTSLDLSLNTSLSALVCSDNQLTTLNVKNGNNANITDFFAQNNPDLFCIEVDNLAYSTNNWINIDAQTSFSEDCSAVLTYVPDDNFEQALIDLGYDSGPLDDYVPTANIETVDFLDISNKNIEDLTGIEDFVALEVLSCISNNLTELDLSPNPILETLYCYANQLTQIDVSQNTLLTILNCSNNQLTSLDVSQNTALTSLSCALNQLSNINVSNNVNLTQLTVNENNLTDLNVTSNDLLANLSFTGNDISGIDLTNNLQLLQIFGNNCQLSSIDVSANTLLERLVISSNDLNNLDLTSNTALKRLSADNNNLTTLDLSNHTQLVEFYGINNQFSSLNLKNGNNTNVTAFFATNNPDLLCIEVDDVAYSTTNWTNIDAQTNFSEDCSLSVDDMETSSIKIYPNPVSDVITVSSITPIDSIAIYDMLGKKVMSISNANHINVNQLIAGVYFIKIKSNAGEVAKKIIKK